MEYAIGRAQQPNSSETDRTCPIDRERTTPHSISQKQRLDRVSTTKRWQRESVRLRRTRKYQRCSNKPFRHSQVESEWLHATNICRGAGSCHVSPENKFQQSTLTRPIDSKILTTVSCAGTDKPCRFAEAKNRISRFWRVNSSEIQDKVHDHSLLRQCSPDCI